MQYAGFWKRYYAGIVDFLVLLPFTVLFFWLDSYSRNVAILAAIPFLALFSLYSIFFHAKWGKTIGKMAAGIKVVTVEGNDIGWKQALSRNSVDLSFSLLITIGQIVALTKISDAMFAQGHSDGLFSITFAEYAVEMQKLDPVPRWFIHLQQIWIWSELVTLLFNKKKRALHDFIAGTVVITK